MGPVIADVPENSSTDVQIEFPQHDVCFVCDKCETSLLDSPEESTNSVRSGTGFRVPIGDFELYVQGVPRLAIHGSQIFDLGESVNFGRMHWTSTALRRVGDFWSAAPEATRG